MDNKINFTGLKNTAALQFIKCNTVNNEKIINTNMLVQLTDDFNGKDLTEFYDVVKKCKTLGFEIPRFNLDKNFIYLSCQKSSNTSYLPNLYINGKRLASKNATMPMYSYIMKLAKRVSKMAEKNEIEVNKDFKYGEDAPVYINPFNEIKLELNNSDMDGICSQENVKQGFDIVQDVITERMNAFFA